MTVRIFRISPAKIGGIRQVVALDHWARNGYTLQAAKTIGINIDDYVLYVDGPDAFFASHLKEVLIEGVTEVKGNEFDNIKKAFAGAEDSTASGIAMFD